MDGKSKIRLEESAPEVLRHLTIGSNPEESVETISIRRALRIVRAIQKRPRTARELGQALELSPHTIFEYLGALEAEGFPLQRSPGPVEQRTGRPETIFSIYLKPSGDRPHQRPTDTFK